MSKTATTNIHEMALDLAERLTDQHRARLASLLQAVHDAASDAFQLDQALWTMAGDGDDAEYEPWQALREQVGLDHLDAMLGAIYGYVLRRWENCHLGTWAIEESEQPPVLSAMRHGPNVSPERAASIFEQLRGQR